MKIYKIMIIALSAFAFAACNSTQTKSPTQTLKDFVEASKKKDVAAMKGMLSKASLELMQKTADMQKTTVDELLKKSDETSLNQQTPETREEKIEGERASVETKNPVTGGYDKIPFVKEEGVWKIALDTLMKETLQKMTEEMKNRPTDMPESNASPTKNGNADSANKP